MTVGPVGYCHAMTLGQVGYSHAMTVGQVGYRHAFFPKQCLHLRGSYLFCFVFALAPVRYLGPPDLELPSSCRRAAAELPRDGVRVPGICENQSKKNK